MQEIPKRHEELLRLLKQVENIDHSSSGMVQVAGSIPGTGFFPGALGSWDPSAALCGRPIMVLGQDQDRVSGLRQSLIKGNELYAPTWRNLQFLFEASGIDTGLCFFTNFIMGVRQSDVRNTGPSPALAHPAFMRACASLFLEQLQVQQPRVILTLGMIPFQLLSLVSSDLRHRAVGIAQFADLDARNMHVIENVVFDDVRGTIATVVPICHPCQPQNGKGRSTLWENEHLQFFIGSNRLGH